MLMCPYFVFYPLIVGVNALNIHDYSPIVLILGMLKLSDRQIDAKLQFV